MVQLLPYDGSDATFVNAQIVADTVATGGMLPNRVYELTRDQYYLSRAQITMPKGRWLRIRAAAGEGKKPVIFLWEQGSGANPTRPPGNFAVLNGGNVDFQNICIAGFYEPEPNRVNTVQGGLIQTAGAGSTILLDGCVLSNINGQHVRTNQNTIKVQATNCIFANMGALQTSNLGAGKGIDLREVSCDSFIVVNNTFVNYQDRAIRHYNFSNPAAGTGEIKYGRIEHNTFINGMGFHGLLSLGNVGPEIIISSNLFVDAFALGEDPTDATRKAEWANTGEFYPDGSNRICWIFTAPNETTQWEIGNNFFAISDSGKAFLDDFGYGVGSPLSWHINSRLGADSVNAFVQDEIELANIPNLMTNMMRWYESPTGGNRIKDQTNFVTARDDYDRRPIEYYRDEFDASYPTFTTAYMGGEDGFPAGDLNWFPDMKARWEGGLPAAELVVVNPSFELPGTAKQKAWDNAGANDVPGWSSDTPATDSGVESTGIATDGVWTGFLKGGDDPAVWQTTEYPIRSGEVYLLQVDAKDNWQATTLQLILYYLDGGARVAAATADVPVTGAMQTFSLMLTADDLPAAIGKRIGVQMENVSPKPDSWIGMDNVRLGIVTNEIVVDGNKDPFYYTLTGPDDGYLQIRAYAGSDNGAPVDDADLSAKIWTAWDDTWFYLYEEVMDDTLSGSATNVWEEDEIELKVDPQATDSTKNSVWDTRLTALDAGEGDVVAADNLNSVAGAADKQYARKIIPGGYALELAFKWSVVKNGTETITPGDGTVFGMGINQHNNDGAARRQASITWAAALKDAIWNTPKYHGTVKFLADNKLQFIPTNNVTGLTNPTPYDGSFYLNVDAKKDPFYKTLTGPDDGYLQIRSFAASDNGAPVDDADLSAKIWTAWDDTWFYLYEEVMDDTLSGSATNVWEEDEIELKVDPQPTDSTKNSVWDTRLTALGMGDEDVVAADSLNAIAAADKKWARAKIAGGYALELAFKWSVVKSGTETITAAVDEVFGMGINQHDNDGAARRQASITWAAALKDAIWNTPKYHGTVKFLAENKLQFIPKNNVTGLTNTVPYDGSDLTGVETEKNLAVPLVFNLAQNYPNPFNPSTMISYSIPSASDVRLSVFDVLGREVAVLVDEKQSAGIYTTAFNGRTLSSGIYFCRLQADKQVKTQKMMFMK